MSPAGNSLYTPNNFLAEPFRKILQQVSLHGDPLGCSDRATPQVRVELSSSKPGHQLDRIIIQDAPNCGNVMQPIGLRNGHHVPTRIFHRDAPVRG